MEQETIFVIMRSFYIDSEEFREVVTARKSEEDAIKLCDQWNKEAKDDNEDESYWYVDTELI